MKPILPSSVSIISADKAPPGSIKEGSRVFVRVLAREASGRYTVSFAGQRFSVASQRNLEKGSSFSASVRVRQGRVFLVPLAEEKTFAKKEAGVTHFSSFASDKTGTLSSLLHELGLPADTLSFRLLSFFQENAVQFDRHSALRARSLAKRFPGREEAAAEASLLLTEKGIEPDEASVAEILALWYGEYTREKNNDGTQEKEPEQFGSRKEDTPSLIESLYTDADHCLSLPAGLLSFLNQYKTGERHWVFLPFDYKCGDCVSNGVIRLLFDLGQKRTEKIIISAFSTVKDYFFVVYFKRLSIGSGERAADLDFCINPSPSVLCIKDFERLLQAVLPQGCNVRYKPNLFGTDGLANRCFFSRVEAEA